MTSGSRDRDYGRAGAELTVARAHSFRKTVGKSAPVFNATRPTDCVPVGKL